MSGETSQEPVVPAAPAVPAADVPGQPSPTGNGPEAEAAEAAARAAEATGTAACVEPPEQTIERLTEEREQLKDRYLRLAAEFDNFRKRMQRERLELWARAQAEVVARVLDALDDLGRVAHLDPASTAARDVVAGVELVERKLLRELEGAGLERVGAAGEPFDPNRHEAVASVPAASREQDHTVAAVLQPGYRFGGALLRPARVSVAVWQDSGPADGGEPRS